VLISCAAASWCRAFHPTVLKEALRRYSVVPVVTRSLKEDDVMEGQVLPAGAMVVCHLQVCSALASLVAVCAAAQLPPRATSASKADVCTCLSSDVCTSDVCTCLSSCCATACTCLSPH
jgi:hypothetical protein